MFLNLHKTITKFGNQLLNDHEIDCSILRLDLIHPQVSGNKWFKLKYNLTAFQDSGKTLLITIGGAYSNHLVATAAACNSLGVSCVGIIRGEEPSIKNERIMFLEKIGMQLHYVSRTLYRDKKELEKWIGNNFASYFFLPEGGSNTLAVKGCAEILNESMGEFDLVICPCGTGTTIAGIAAGPKIAKEIIGIPVLKNGDFLKHEIDQLLSDYSKENDVVINSSYKLFTEYDFGGYAKTTDELDHFIIQTNEEGIPLEFVYSAKAFYALNNLVKNGYIKKRAKVLFIHTGGIFVDK